jgi:hypothetical protein
LGQSLLFGQITAFGTAGPIGLFITPKSSQETNLIYMIFKSKRNKVIDRRLIPGNWFDVWLYKVLELWVSYSWCLCYTLWLGTLKATGSCIPAWEPLWVCWYTCIYVLQCDCILCLYAFKIVLVGTCINPVLHF